MSAIRKYSFWVLAGLILLAELIFAAFPLRWKSSANAQQRAKIESQQRELERLISGTNRTKLANREVLQNAMEYRGSVERSYLELILFLLERDSRLERMEPPAKDPQSLTRGELARRVEEYNRLTDALRQQALQAGITLNEKSIAKADWRGRVPSAAQVSDAFKMLWLQRVCVAAMMPPEPGAEPLVRTIDSFRFARRVHTGGASSLAVLEGEKEYNRILFFLGVSMHFAHLPAFVSQVLQSDPTIDVRGFEVDKPVAKAAAPEGDRTQKAVQPEDMRLVQVLFAFEAVDFVADIHKVTFDKAVFRTAGETTDWIRTAKLGTGQTTRLYRYLLNRLQDVKPTPGRGGFEYILLPDERISKGKKHTIQIDNGVTAHVGITRELEL